jgi:hypothetical protein
MPSERIQGVQAFFGCQLKMLVNLFGEYVLQYICYMSRYLSLKIYNVDNAPHVT